MGQGQLQGVRDRGRGQEPHDLQDLPPRASCDIRQRPAELKERWCSP